MLGLSTLLCHVWMLNPSLYREGCTFRNASKHSDLFGGPLLSAFQNAPGTPILCTCLLLCITGVQRLRLRVRC